MTDRIYRPKHSITITTYHELRSFIKAFAEGKLNLVILVGPAGVAKSQTAREAVGRDACWLEGNATSFGIYQALYKYKDQPVVIDDVDSLYSDRAAVRLLKCVCQTDPVKKVAWHSNAASLTAEGTPREFETTSRVLIIANDWKSLDANVAAVQDRGHLVFFEPTPEEIHFAVAQWFDDQAIYDWFADHLHLITQPSMRNYLRAKELKECGMDWVKVLLSDIVSDKALLVAKIRSDSALTTEAERVEAFAKAGGGGQTTWYKWSKRMKAPGDTRHLKPLLPKARPKLHLYDDRRVSGA